MSDTDAVLVQSAGQAGSPPAGGATLADQQAARNWAANRQALAATQPHLLDALSPTPVDLVWTFARDSSLTARDPAGRWWTGCSVPRAAARIMLQKLPVRGASSCFLSPTHPAQVEVALAKIEPCQAIIVITPNWDWLRIALRCLDFSADIQAHRLWFAAGPQWHEELDRLFAENPGLPVPQQFIRTITSSEEQLTPLASRAQAVFTQASARASNLIEQARTKWDATRSAERICALAPSHFRLWDDAGAILRETLSGDPEGPWVFLDSDDPAAASMTMLARSVSECDALLATNIARSHLAGILPAEMPLITWLTLPQIPSFDPAHPHDGLLLADPAWQPLARSAGWPADRIKLAAWPIRFAPPAPLTERTLGVIADTCNVEEPPEPFTYSSHQLLWELIRDELAGDPFAIGDVSGYLSARMKRLEIAEEGFDRRLFIEKLIIPAYQQSLVRLLAGAGVPLRLWGAGWANLGQLGQYSAGIIRSKGDLENAVAACTALLHVWPALHAHPIDAVGRPVVRPIGRQVEKLVRLARAVLQGSAKSPSASAEVLSSQSVRELAIMATRKA